MRVFFGLELDANSALQIANWRDRQLACNGHTVPPVNFHITLAFVGPLRDPAIEQLCESVDEWLARSEVSGGILNLDCLGYWAKPGIYWLGPTTWPKPLTQLSGKIRGLATAAGAKKDRKSFQPHITLYRRCSAAPPTPPQAPAIPMVYQHFALFESRQGKQGVSYHSLQDWDLAPAP
ncbi:MAG: RNA 2',3'-cyclic phosphodiesterase [Halioglobus sp.]|nr:RNA 2',3'-cyclic phosphodiesterase [Halioglobus sp.]